MLAAYFTDYYVFLVAILGLMALLTISGQAHGGMNSVMVTSSLAALGLSVLTHVNDYLGMGDTYYPVRFICCVYCYVLRPSIIHTYLESFSKSRKLLIFNRVLLTLNAILFTLSFFTPYVVQIDSGNKFSSPYSLNLASYAVSAVLLVCLFITSVSYLRRGHKVQAALLAFLAVVNMIAVVMDLFADGTGRQLVYSVGVSNCLVYACQYMISQQVDMVTRLPNRQAFFHNAQRKPRTITAVVSIDMNELKWINDTQGHEAGDKALKGVGECATAMLPQGCGVYRIGGDEFFEIIRGLDEAGVNAHIQALREETERRGFSCAIGYALLRDSDFNLACREADDAMYADKQRMKQECAGVHFRQERLKYFRDK